MTMKRTLLAAGILMLIIQSNITGCLGLLYPPPEKYDYFFKLSPSQQCTEAKKYSINEQIELYRLSYFVQHPGNPGLLDVIIDNKESAIPFLLNGMQSDDDNYRSDMVFILLMMSHKYGLRYDRGTLDIVNKGIEEMSSERQKEKSQMYLIKILMNQLPQ